MIACADCLRLFTNISAALEAFGELIRGKNRQRGGIAFKDFTSLFFEDLNFLLHILICDMAGLLELPLNILGELLEVVWNTPGHILLLVLVGLVGLGLGCVSLFFVLSSGSYFVLASSMRIDWYFGDSC